MSARAQFSLAVLDRLTGGRVGTHDVPCPSCGPSRRTRGTHRRRVLRVWRIDAEYATYCCQRCGAHGWARYGSTPRLDGGTLARARTVTAVRDGETAAERRRVAQWLWRVARPTAGTVAETYLRSRGILTAPPATVRFLSPRKRGQHPAMIAVFGVPDEPVPGELAITDNQIRGAHLTLLKPDGSGKAGTGRDKLMIGPSLGFPLVLAQPNDLLGLAITEGIEDGLTVHQETGLGVWAAGAAARMPALAEAVPDYTETVTIYEHADPAGRRGAAELARLLDRRGIEVFIESLTA
jgi:Toprim domain